MAAYLSNLEIVRYFENNGLKNASLIAETAEKQFVNGEINYLDFVLLLNQSISIQNNYAEALKTLNDTVIQLNYLTSN